jgi:hypothetical protein
VIVCNCKRMSSGDMTRARDMNSLDKGNHISGLFRVEDACKVLCQGFSIFVMGVILVRDVPRF